MGGNESAGNNSVFCFSLPPMPSSGKLADALHCRRFSLFASTKNPAQNPQVFT
jgi:hypothetical protein